MANCSGNIKAQPWEVEIKTLCKKCGEKYSEQYPGIFGAGLKSDTPLCPECLRTATPEDFRLAWE